MITGIHISICLHGRDFTAGFAKNAKGMILSQGRCQDLLYDLDLYAADVTGLPFIKYLAEKRAVFFRINTAGPGIDHRQKPYIDGPGFFEKIVNLEGMVHIVMMHNTEDVTGDPVRLQEGKRLHHPGMGGAA